MPDLRVLYVNQARQVSGAERSLLALIKGLEGRVRPMVACPPGELSAELRGLGIEAIPIRGTEASFRLHPLHTSRGLLEMVHSSLQVRRIVGRLSPDIVHANTTRAALLALLARERSGPPVVAHIRDWAPPGRVPDLTLSLIARRAEAVVANSAYVADRFGEGPSRAAVRVIYNPIDLEQFEPGKLDGRAVRGALGIGEGTVVLTVVAQVSPIKGQDTAIRVLADLAASGSDVVLLLAGSVKFASAGAHVDNVGFAEKLPALASELGVEDRVRFLGERSDVPDLLAATDVLLMPFWRDAFGRVAVEAMAMSVPVAAANVGGPTEIVRDRIDGRLLPPRDPGAWSAALGPLVESRARREEMGRAGRARAADFSVEKHADGVLAVYEGLISPRGQLL
jgi:glycosyltransferase involved in cell wall biosynthesis